jgi:hypothetical protein
LRKNFDDNCANGTPIADRENKKSNRADQQWAVTSMGTKGPTMRLLRFIHEEITNPFAGREAKGEKALPETGSEPELKEEIEHNGVLASTAVSGI